MNAASNTNQESKLHRWIVLVLAFVILGASMYGFGDKFVQFVKVASGEPDGWFALTPITNYLLASFGFLFLLGWAAGNGMFHDIERPKHAMLEVERRLDEAQVHEGQILHEEILK